MKVNFENMRVLAAITLMSWFAMTACHRPPTLERTDYWRIEIGPEGNEFYEYPKKNGDPPSETALRWTEIFTPGYSFVDDEPADDGYEMTVRKGHDEYEYEFDADGDLSEIDYKNTDTNIDEEADEIVPRGKKHEIAMTEVPRVMLRTLTQAYPNRQPRQYWLAETIVGPRYIVRVSGMAFYGTPDGKIRCAGRVKDGALNEIGPAPESDDTGTDQEAEKLSAEEALGQFGDRFNFEKVSKEKLRAPGKSDGGLRYVVMGDSRSNRLVWEKILNHINSLDPKPEFIIATGDVVQVGEAVEFRDYLFPVLETTDIPYFIAIGNHDDGRDGMATAFRYVFGANALNYYFDYSKCRFIFVDTVSKVQPASETIAWLDQTLTETPEGYRKFVSAHKPPSTITKWAYHAWNQEASDQFTALMTRHQVDHVYLGHIHAYSTAHHDGVDYTISGGGGASLHDRYGPSGNVNHYVICDVTPEKVTRQVVRFYYEP